MAKKPSRKTTHGKPIPPNAIPANGGYLVPGAGGGPQPGAGRPKNEWKAALQAMVSRDEVLGHVAEALAAGPAHPFFKDALHYATEHGYGKATQSHDVEGGGTLADILTRIAQARG